MKSLGHIHLVAAVLIGLLTFGSSSIAQQHEHKAQQEEGTIKLATDLVSLNVMVTDQSGRAILGLKKEDFKVYEDRVEQPISFFSCDENAGQLGDHP
jgi:uncharacterized protein YggE